MIVPSFWAEGRARFRQPGRQVTVRRFGWSESSQAEAQANADNRAQEALQRVLSGEKLPRREPKIPYNGAQGVPIREEIVQRQGTTVVTRNSYGARCLNTPNVLFVDIDFASEAGWRFYVGVMALLLLCGAVIGSHSSSGSRGLLWVFIALAFTRPLGKLILRGFEWLQGGREKMAWRRIDRFLKRHPQWGVRIYRTPAGLRVLVTHGTFQPRDPVVAECFAALGADPVYVRMCLNQNCFRARVSPKPWRIGVSAHMKPRPGVWPVRPERLPMRQEWISGYEKMAESFAACALVTTLGGGVIHPEAGEVMELHDRLCKAESGLPIA